MNLPVIISTLFGAGYFPKASGTAGTLIATLVYLLLPPKLFGSLENNIIFLICVLTLSLISVFFISKAEKKLGHDNNKIVLDEFLGYFIAVVFLPKTIIIAVFAFILFRFFDISKPEPVNILQKLPAGWGVMADDLMAGVYTNISLQILIRVFPKIIK
ncbi:MAG: phosphatidylglycerophosphatase A [Candidatus Cloacimonetes bacterium]|nr:phosphatidylglycerophosphatase A [Candidatus Cloacimonadota bacterium]MBL7149258.1 phosphatidylglycerophosphatase A [Candidatus Cloacimonadota bacterium]